MNNTNLPSDGPYDFSAFSERVAQLNNRVAQLDDRVTQLNNTAAEQVTSLCQRVETLEYKEVHTPTYGTIDGLSGRLNTCSNDLFDLNQRLKSMEKRITDAEQAAVSALYVLSLNRRVQFCTEEMQSLQRYAYELDRSHRLLDDREVVADAEMKKRIEELENRLKAVSKQVSDIQAWFRPVLERLVALEVQPRSVMITDQVTRDDMQIMLDELSARLRRLEHGEGSVPATAHAARRITPTGA